MVESSRRFDTDAVLQRIMKGDKSAFEAFYERYRGRVYRFVVRQYGTGDIGTAAYYSAWRHLVVSSRTSQSPKELKFLFFQNLGKSSQGKLQHRHMDNQASYLPRDLEEDSKWPAIFMEHFRSLPEAMMKRFLFKHEIGLRTSAIARILNDQLLHIEKSIEEAERILRKHMNEAGCPAGISLDQLYRESRVVKPPARWNDEILDSFAIWLKQGETKTAARHANSDELRDAKGGIGHKLQDAKGLLGNKLTGLMVMLKANNARRKLGNSDKKQRHSIFPD